MNDGRLPRITEDLAHRGEVFALTDMQQAYWIGRNDGFEMGNVACHLYLEVDIPRYDVAQVERAWNLLIQRHDMLRAVIHMSGQQQIFARTPHYTIAVQDLRDRSEAESEAALAEVRAQLSHQVFTPERWPLFDLRASLLPAPRALRLHISIDALLADGWSAVLLFGELAQLCRDPEHALPPLSMSFRDYVNALPAIEASPLYQRSLRYWKERAATLPPAPQLPLARAPGSIAHPCFLRRSARLASAHWQRLGHHARQSGLSPIGVLLAAYVETLATFSASSHLTINVPRFNRLPLHPQMRELVGNFSSFTLLESRPDPRHSFVERARDLYQRLLQDLSHDHVSGVRVLREIKHAQGRGAQNAMPVVFTSLLNLASSGGRFLVGDLGTLSDIVSQTPQVWLDCQVYEDDGALVVAWDGVEELFPAGLLDDMFAAYNALLRELAQGGELWSGAQAQLVPPAQLAQRAAINHTDAPQTDRLLHDLFLEQAARTPKNLALLSDGRWLTYEELRDRTSALARTLQSRGVTIDSPVAVVMRKGWEQVVAVLAILQAGAAYLPIDSELPVERLRYLLANGGVRVALTQPALLGRLGWPDGVEPVAVLDEAPPAGPAARRVSRTNEDLAYVMYTSGSTGAPKGVMVEHRSAVNAILYANQRCQATAADRILALTALHHDLSVYDLFGPLAVGAAIVIPQVDRLRDPSHWLDLIRRDGVSLWNTVPAMMEMLVEHAEGVKVSIPGSLREVILGGDWIPVSLPGRLRGLCPGARVHSIGGPTETTIWNIWHTVERVDPNWASIPYGRPITNNRYFVLSDEGVDCPTWVPGELHCAGVGVARGYWRDPAMTAERFYIHPRIGERLYRTGDIGRFLPNGNIEFLGRRDSQVKLRGQRVDLGEIEATLLQHPQINGAVAVVAGEGAGRHLAAFVVARGASAPVKGGDVPFAGIGKVLSDPLERARFKLSQHGLRNSDGLPAVAAAPVAEQGAALDKRRSHRDFSQAPLPLSQVGALLHCLHQGEHHGLPKYRYPSAGGLYPVQVYLAVQPGRIDGLAEGVYYYHPRTQQLLKLSSAVLPVAIHAAHNQAIAQRSAFGLCLVGRMAAIHPMYGTLARDFALVEAGCITQLLMTEAQLLGLGLCPIGALDFAAVRSDFALDPGDELLFSLWGGGAVAAQDAVDAALSAEGVRRYLGSKLPGHIVPTTIMLLESLPTTANGKVDRRALAIQAVAPPAAPMTGGTEMEQSIARVWQEFLPHTTLALDTNFFDLGTDSLVVVKAHNRLRAVLGREFPVVTIFKYPTIRALADYLSSAERPSAGLQDGATRAEQRRRLMEQMQQARRSEMQR